MTVIDLVLAMNAVSPIGAALEEVHAKHFGPGGYFVAAILGLTVGAITVIGEYKAFDWLFTGMHKKQLSEHRMNYLGGGVLFAFLLFPFATMTACIWMTDSCLKMFS